MSEVIVSEANNLPILSCDDPYLPHEAEIIERIQEGPDIFTLRLQFTDPEVNEKYHYKPGQFNMLYLFGCGEVAISIVSDPDLDCVYDHTIRVVGRVTRGMSELKKGDKIGVRGPYGRGWPMQAAWGKDVIIITGGLGCAPVISVVKYLLQDRDLYGHITFLQGVKHSNDLIYTKRYDRFKEHKVPNFDVLVAADEAVANWPWYEGRVIDLVPKAKFDPDNAVCFMCGPEMMMRVGVKELRKLGMANESIYLNMERNMQCAIGHCGHCQYGSDFICKDGPVFSYPEIQHLLGREGF